VAQFPTDGQYGWYLNTSTGNYSFVLNNGGVLAFQDLRTFTGNISAAQHGDLSGSAATFHQFPSITGTITDLQHGVRSGANLHDAATGSVNGFMSATDKTKLNDITATGTATNLLNATQLQINGVKVVGAQGAAITDPDGTLANAVSRIQAILNRLRAHGLIDT